VFSDVPPDAYFAAAVQHLVCTGVLTGYSDGTFRPYAPVTRAQAAKVIGGVFPHPPARPPSATFADVGRDSVFYAPIETAAAAGLFAGYTCGSRPAEPCDGVHRPYFRPSVPLTRRQLAQIVALAAGWPLPVGDQPFADVAPDLPGPVALACRNVAAGYTCGGPSEPCDALRRPYFRPAAALTRGQLAKIVTLAAAAPAFCAAPSRR